MIASNGTVPAREHLALALDLDDLEAAVQIAAAVGEHFAVAKVGLELFSAVGPEAVRVFRELGYRVFLDLKLHDIPTTVNKAARVIGRLGVSYVTVHTQGGGPMLEAAAEGLAAGAAEGGLAPPVALGVTVLTSDPTTDAATLSSRAALACTSGMGGLVCAAPDLPIVRAAAPGLVTVVPGTRPSGSSSDDQARVTTPAAAVRLGADLLVIGRAVTGSADPAGSAAAIALEVAAAQP